MPTVFNLGPYKFYFYSNENHEPWHVHVDRDGCTAKIWLDGPREAGNYGFSAKEMKKIIELVKQNLLKCQEKWNEYFKI